MDPYISPQPDQQAKRVAVISYITFIGWLIAYLVFYQKNKDRFVAFHLRQTLLLNIISFGLSLIERNRFWPFSFASFVSGIIGIYLFLCWLIGIVGAIKGEEKLMPVFGIWAQEWFTSL